APSLSRTPTWPSPPIRTPRTPMPPLSPVRRRSPVPDQTLTTHAGPPTRPATLPAPGAAGALSTYRTLLRWTLSQIGAMLPLIILVQALLAAGIIVGFGFLIPDIDTSTALFLSTGAPTVLLLVIGLVMVPQGVAQARTDGTFH